MTVAGGQPTYTRRGSHAVGVIVLFVAYQKHQQLLLQRHFTQVSLMRFGSSAARPSAAER